MTPWKLFQVEPLFVLYWQVEADSVGVICRSDDDELEPDDVDIAPRMIDSVTSFFFEPVTVKRAAFDDDDAIVTVPERAMVPKVRPCVPVTTIVTTL